MKRQIITILFIAGIFLILPNIVLAQSGYCTCPTIIFTGGSVNPDRCYGTISPGISADCDWVSSQCVCSKIFSEQMTVGECLPTPDAMLDQEIGGEYTILKTSLGSGVLVTGGCTWRSAEATDGTPPDIGTPPGGDGSIPGRVDLEPPFGQGDQDSVTYIQETIGLVIQWALGIVGSIALLMFVLGGFIWLTSAGNPDRIQRGKSILIWATIGLFVIFAAYAITRAVFVAILGY